MPETEIMLMAAKGGPYVLAAFALWRISRIEAKLSEVLRHLSTIECPKHKRAGIAAPLAALASGLASIIF